MPGSSPFFWRLFLSFSLILVSTLLVCDWVFLSVLEQQEKNSLDDRLAQLVDTRAAVLPAIPLGAEAMNTLDTELHELARRSGLRFTLVDGSGEVRIDTAGEGLRTNVLLRPEFQLAMEAGQGRAETPGLTPGQSFHFYAVPLRGEDGSTTGYLRGGYSDAELAVRLGALANRVHGGLMISGMVLFVAVLLLSWRLWAPVQRITSLAETIAHGDFERRLPVNQLGLGRLAQAINQLARTSAQRVSTVTADRNRLAAVFAGLVEGVIDVDEHLHIQHINEAAAKLLDLNPTTSLNKPLWQEVRIKAITVALDQAMRGRDVVRTQMRLARERDEVVVNIHVASLSNESGKPLGAVIVLNDITELEKLSRVRTDFVANASHELKTPITAIRGLAETVLSDGEMDRDSVQRFTSRIHAQSMRLSQLVSDLMAISRLESMHEGLEYEPVNLVQVVRQAAGSVQGAAELRQQQLAVSLPDTALVVMGDRHNLNQLVDNLIDNAIKYTQEKGRISVRLAAEGDWVVLEVQDNGIGISPQYQQRIFERFYRVDKVRSQGLGGTGLGLSIVKNIVEKHLGKISLRSQPGSGSTFRVLLPREP